MEKTRFANIFDFAKSLQKGSFAGTLITKTPYKMLKRGNPFADRNIEKVTMYRQIVFGISYENRVNAQLEREGKEGDFKSQSLTWGEWTVYPYRIDYKGSTYLRFYTNPNKKNMIKRLGLLIDGKPATAEETAILESFASQSGGNPNGTFSINVLNVLSIENRKSVYIK